MVEELFEFQILNLGHEKGLTFPNFKRVYVFKCPSLKSIFSASIARGLSPLVKLHVYDCGRLEETLIAKEGLEPTEFVFSQLTRLWLSKLPNLMSFCRRPHSSRFPLLGRLVVIHCLKTTDFLGPKLSSLQASTHGSLFITDKLILYFNSSLLLFLYKFFSFWYKGWWLFAYVYNV